MATYTGRPTGGGSYYGQWFSPYSYTNIDDTTPDDDASYVQKTYDGYTKTECYTFASPDIPSGSTNISLRVYFRPKGGTAWGGAWVNGYYYGGTGHNCDSYTTYYNDYSVNPSTSAAWTVDDINGVGAHPFTQIGIKMDCTYADPTRVTQIYFVITYTPPPASPYSMGGCGINTADTASQAFVIGT